MNDTQLFSAIGIPRLLVILNMSLSSRISDKQLGARIDRLAADNHRDHLMIMRDQVELNERVAKMEVKQGAKSR